MTPQPTQKYTGQFKKKIYNGKKIPLIPPRFINNELEPDFKLKANFLNKFFVDKCTPM